MFRSWDIFLCDTEKIVYYYFNSLLLMRLVEVDKGIDDFLSPLISSIMWKLPKFLISLKGKVFYLNILHIPVL